MKKSERINDLIRFLNNFSEFNLKDIMMKYDISKSTALRDIQSLEELGMPIFSDLGRYGKYGVLKNSLLSPILFTMDEIFALYFAMQTINSYQSTPFHMQTEQLNEKFQNCLSTNQQLKIKQMRNVLQFETNKYNNTCELLDEILSNILNENISTITYEKKGLKKVFRVKFFRITAKFGQWYTNALDISNGKFIVFRCDRIKSIKIESMTYPLSVNELNQKLLKILRENNNIEYEVEINDRGKDFFYKEHYPNMSLTMGEKMIIRGNYYNNETDFITNYFIGYGDSIISIKPIKLANLIHDKITLLHSYYKRVLTTS